MRHGAENKGGGGGKAERRPYLSPRKETLTLKSILRQGHMETTEKEAILLPVTSTNCTRPYLVHVGVKVGPILKVDLHCWVHGGG